MNNIPLFIFNGTAYTLRFHDAVHPMLLNQKAERWSFVYQIYSDAYLFDPGLFANNFILFEKEQFLIIEEYYISISDKNNVQTENDVKKNLRLFDFKKGKTGRFSKLTGGDFLLQRIAGNSFIYSKQYLGRTSEFEIDIAKIELVDFGKL